jgi:pilus assembly protein CpaB
MVAALQQRRTTLIIALVLALGAGWLLMTYLSNLQRQANAASAPVHVVVAAQPIPPRVQITAAMLGTVTRPASAVDPNAITDPKDAVGALSLITIPAGASLTSAMVGRPSDVGLTVRLKAGMRAVSVAIDKIKGISGLVQPGDYVDVIAQPARAGAAPPVASTILRGVRVLAIGPDLESASATPSPEEQNAATVTLEVTPKQADLLVMADLNTTLRLALRSPKEPLNSEPTEAIHWGTTEAGNTNGGGGDGTDNSGALATAALIKELQGPAAAQTQRSASSPSFGPVTVIDGDHYAGAESSGGT